jgi:hypothetical protein
MFEDKNKKKDEVKVNNPKEEVKVSATGSDIDDILSLVLESGIEESEIVQNEEYRTFECSFLATQYEVMEDASIQVIADYFDFDLNTPKQKSVRLRGHSEEEVKPLMGHYVEFTDVLGFSFKTYNFKDEIDGEEFTYGASGFKDLGVRENPFKEVDKKNEVSMNVGIVDFNTSTIAKVEFISVDKSAQARNKNDKGFVQFHTTFKNEAGTNKKMNIRFDMNKNESFSGLNNPKLIGQTLKFNGFSKVYTKNAYFESITKPTRA